MLNVPESIKTLYKTDGINKNFRVHFPNGENEDLTNKDIVEGSVKFTESVSSKDVLKFGLTEQAKIEFECVGVQNMMGMTIECGNEIDISSLTNAEIQEIQSGDYEGTLVLAASSDIGYGYYRIPYGVFTVASCPRQMGAMKHRRVTGYSKSYAELFDNNDIFNSVYLCSSISIDTSFFDWLVDHSIYPKDTLSIRRIDTNVFSNGNGYLYNQNKKAVTIDVQGGTWMHWLTLADNRVSLPRFDILEMNATGDLTKYEENGMAIVKCIDQNGYDFTYNQDGKKIYSSNEEAIRAVYPALFSPCLEIDAGGGVSGAPNAGAHISGIPIRGQFTVNPYVNAVNNAEAFQRTKAIRGAGFPEHVTGSKVYWDYCNLTFHAMSSPTGIMKVKVSNKSDWYADADWTVTEHTYEKVDYSYNVESAYSYYATGATTGCRVRLNPSLTSNMYTTLLYNADTVKSLSNVKFKTYIYENSISPRSAVVSRLELQAKFGNVNRHGVKAERGLSRNNPTELNESMLEDLWWDEYDVEQIGKVTYKMGDTNNEVEYTIGDGGSTYEFGDNYLTKRLFNVYEEAYKGVENVNSYIDANFIPNIDDVPFVPVNMSMIGLPYLEAGDPLRINVTEDLHTMTATAWKPVTLKLVDDTLRETYEIKRAVVKMEPFQSSLPYAADKGKNHMPYPYLLTTWTRGGVTCTNTTYRGMKECLVFSGTSTGVVDFPITNNINVHEGRYVIRSILTEGQYVSALRFALYNGGTVIHQASCNGSASSFTVDSEMRLTLRILCNTLNFDFTGCCVLPIITRYDEQTYPTYSPYENIVQIKFPRTSATITNTVDGTATDYTVDFPQEAGDVYGGEVDFTNGKLTSTYSVIDSYNSEDIPDHWYSDRDKWRAVGDKPTIGAMVVYPSEPVEYDVTSYDIPLSDGENSITTNTDAGMKALLDVEYSTIIETYMLNRELSGVQTLFDDIEANGGEVLGD